MRCLFTQDITDNGGGQADQQYGIALPDGPFAEYTKGKKTQQGAISIPGDFQDNINNGFVIDPFEDHHTDKKQEGKADMHRHPDSLFL